MDPRARGTNHLIREGATLTESAEDVFTVLADARAPEKAEIIVDNQYTMNESTSVEATISARDEIIAALGPTPTTV
ncbi:MAG TPA: DNA-protecting protein DprA, partial [Rhodospirillaceae bacterium]|nr:DNA-protecting protein DprA [Rhodospirillaceae bacterium]